MYSSIPPHHKGKKEYGLNLPFSKILKNILHTKKFAKLLV